MSDNSLIIEVAKRHFPFLSTLMEKEGLTLEKVVDAILTRHIALVTHPDRWRKTPKMPKTSSFAMKILSATQFGYFKETLEKYRRNFITLRGGKSERLQLATEQIDKLLYS